MCIISPHHKLRIISCVSQVMQQFRNKLCKHKLWTHASSSCSHHKSCMYRKIMIQIYLLEDVCKKLYVKIILRHYNVLEKIMWTKNLSKKDWDNARSVAQKPIVRHPLVRVSWAGRNASVLSPYWRMSCTTLNKDGSCGARSMRPLFLPKQHCTAKIIFSFPSKL